MERKKGQMGIMEYILMTFFIMVVIVIIIILLTGWQVSQLRFEEQRGKTQRVLSAMKNAVSSEFLVKDKDIFDDSKLLVMMDKCEELERIMGKDVFFEVTVFGEDIEAPCKADKYDPQCNKWTFCKKEVGMFEAYVIPVNVYRKFGITLPDGLMPRMQLGVLLVGVYFEE